jgi:hypothetical protein
MTSRLVALGLPRQIVALTALLGLLAGGSLSAQSLASVAKEAEAKRKTTKSSGKVYTNDQLKSDPRDVSTPASSSAATPPPASDVTADDKAKPDEAKQAKDEAYWRDRMKAEREALARAETFAGALQSQINGLYGEFTACQAPPQCNEISARRQKSIAELDRVKKEVALHTKGVADIQEEARKAGVPAGWVR